MLDKTRSKVTKPTRAKSKTSKSSSSTKTSSVPSPKSTQLPKTSKSSKPSKPTQSSSPHPPPPTMPATTTTTTTSAPAPLPPLRDLASSNPTLRRAALATVTSHLSSLPATASLSPTQAQQLWRALYVALYMHDSKSAVSVQNLARSLAGLGREMWAKDRAGMEAGSKGGQGAVIGGEAEDGSGKWRWSSIWMEAFWGEMAREWVGVDQWRMNKVLMLVRMVVAEGFVLAVESTVAGGEEGGERGEGNSDDDDTWQDYVAEVVALPLEVQRTLPDGLRMHVLDVWGDELDKLVGEDGEQDAESERKEKEVANMLVQAAKELSVFRQGEVNVPKNVRTRAKEVVQKYGSK